MNYRAKSDKILQMKDYLEKLNKEQLAATTATEGAVLVLAGAGSGKTRVLTSRIAYILDNDLCDPSQILAITFTNKAANEMRERLQAFIGEKADRMWISTIHSMCLRILRASVGRLNGYDKNFTVYGEVETERIIKKIIAELGVEGDSVLKNAKFHISYAKTNDISPDRYIIEGSGNDLATFSSIYKRYEEVLRSSNAMDFDDLILKTYHLLDEDDEVRNYYATKFHYIHIDEFQDTNNIQYKIAKLLSSVHGNIFAVGDDDQSIYGWRGAEIKNILGFSKDFKGSKVFKLQQNYRSTKKILDLANAIIKKNSVRSQKTLWTENDDGVRIEYYCGEDETAEALYTINHIKSLVERGAKYSDFAILMRVNALSRSYEQALLRSNIPFKVFGGFKFFERKEIKDLTAYLRLVANPLDNDALLRIINTPKRGIGDKTITELSRFAESQGVSLFDALCSINELSLSANAKLRLDLFRQVIFDLALIGGAKNLSTLVDETIKRTDFLSQFSEETEENMSKKMNVGEFVNSVEEYCKYNKNGTLEDYLSSIALYSDIDEADSTEYVTIATVHAVKGLEFNTVFIAGLDETIFPISRAVGSPADMEEERRLMYVAVTRAEKRLYLTRANSRYLYGNRQFTAKSRFLTDVADKITPDPESARRQRYIDSNEFGDGFSQRRKQTFAERNSFYDSKEYEYGYSQDVPSSDTGMSSYAKTFSRSTPKKDSKNTSGGYTIGRSVMHKKFGLGKIIAVKSSGNNLVIDVAFQKVGIKSLAVNFAPIELL